MTGHQPIVSMRRRGVAPVTVILTFDPALCNRDWHRTDGRIAYVAIDNAENPSRLDLRYLVGLPVVILGDVGDRVRELASAVMAAKPKRLVAGILERELPAGESFRTVERFDSEQGAQWQPC